MNKKSKTTETIIEENKVEEKSRVDELESLLKKYPSIISIIPILGIILALVGAIPQVIELWKLGNGYLRYFSTTQLISDGLIIIAAPAMSMIGYLILNIGIENTQKDKEVDWIKLLGILLRAPLIYIQYKLSLTISLNIFLFTTLAYLVVLYNKTLSKRLIIGLKLSLIIVSLMSILWICLSFTNRSQMTATENINIKNLINRTNVGNIKSEIKYMNDKYIFFEVTNNSGTFIEIRPFEELFTSNSSTNSGHTTSTP